MSRGQFSCSLHGLPLGDIPCRQCVAARNDPKRLGHVDRITQEAAAEAEERRLERDVVEAALAYLLPIRALGYPQALREACDALAAFRKEKGTR